MRICLIRVKLSFYYAKIPENPIVGGSKYYEPHVARKTVRDDLNDLLGKLEEMHKHLETLQTQVRSSLIFRFSWLMTIRFCFLCITVRHLYGN